MNTNICGIIKFCNHCNNNLFLDVCGCNGIPFENIKICSNMEKPILVFESIELGKYNICSLSEDLNNFLINEKKPYQLNIVIGFKNKKDSINDVKNFNTTFTVADKHELSFPNISNGFILEHSDYLNPLFNKILSLNKECNILLTLDINIVCPHPRVCHKRNGRGCIQIDNF
tara:strand:- start:3457 stop:3972 length:516 start_codon:yes stop_codon:yes gene_type:complete